jgi:hypothetical protein
MEKRAAIIAHVALASKRPGPSLNHEVQRYALW